MTIPILDARATDSAGAPRELLDRIPDAQPWQPSGVRLDLADFATIMASALAGSTETTLGTLATTGGEPVASEVVIEDVMTFLARPQFTVEVIASGTSQRSLTAWVRGSATVVAAESLTEPRIVYLSIERLDALTDDIASWLGLSPRWPVDPFGEVVVDGPALEARFAGDPTGMAPAKLEFLWSREWTTWAVATSTGPAMFIIDPAGSDYVAVTRGDGTSTVLHSASPRDVYVTLLKVVSDAVDSFKRIGE